jgi:hypothetical protein
MLNFSGIYQCALHRSEGQRQDETVNAEQVAALRAELRTTEWPPSCPWIGTDAWLQRFVERAEDAMREPAEKDDKGVDKPLRTAAERVRATLKWREENGVNSILAEPLSPLLRHLHAEWPLRAHGVDRFGVPVFYERVALVSAALFSPTVGGIVLISARCTRGPSWTIFRSTRRFDLQFFLANLRRD